jgi:hypothetical protein
MLATLGDFINCEIRSAFRMDASTFPKRGVDFGTYFDTISSIVIKPARKGSMWLPKCTTVSW